MSLREASENPCYRLLMNLKSLSDESLLKQTELAVAREKEATLSVLHHLREVERRQLFAI